MKTLIVTGVPGTGKTTVAKRISNKLNWHYVDVNKLISKNKLYEGFDQKRRTNIINVNKLNKFLINYIKKFKKLNKGYRGLVIDSHLSHYLPRKYVDFCIITKCGIKELNKRLRKRGYSKNKITENLQSEIFDVCYNEALQKKHKVILINTTKSFNIGSIIKQIEP